MGGQGGIYCDLALSLGLSQFTAFLCRNLIGDKTATDPSQLARVVEYVRRQVQHMDRLDSEQLMTKGNITLLPLE